MLTKLFAEIQNLFAQYEDNFSIPGEKGYNGTGWTKKLHWSGEYNGRNKNVAILVTGYANLLSVTVARFPDGSGRILSFNVTDRIIVNGHPPTAQDFENAFEVLAILRNKLLSVSAPIN